jgi:polysaccharide export outer membrane protein
MKGIFTAIEGARGRLQMCVRLGAIIVFCLGMCVCLSGCGNKFWDPTDVGRFRPLPAVNVILDSLSIAEEEESAWSGAEDPRPIDVLMSENDHVLSSGDIIRVSIFELLRENDLFINDYTVKESGNISIPDVGEISAGGLTEAQLEQEMVDILKPSKLKEPVVTVALVRSDRRTFSILGNGVGAPSRYFIPRYGFRLADAIATAGGISEFNVDDIFVSRAVKGEAAEFAPADPVDSLPGEPTGLPEVPAEEMLEIVSPIAASERFDKGMVITSAEMMTGRERNRLNFTAGFAQAANHGAVEAGDSLPGRFGNGRDDERQGASTDGARIEWVFRDGRWVPVRIGGAEPAELPVAGIAEPIVPPLKEGPTDFGWEEIGTGGVQSRVIRIPVDKFQAGDPRYNIVIRPGDTIYVPVNIVGEFYVMGNLNRTGPIPLTGRPMTLKMAIATAGGFGPLAWPKRCEIIRRVGKDKEEIVMVDLDKIFSGEQPDFYIKVNDMINVGTHPTARWRAVLRNAFRATYGFGFVYDRNFADRDFGTHRPFPGGLPNLDDLF